MSLSTLLQAPEEDKFDWARQWYPVAFVDDLDPTKPHPIELLGKRLVLWRDAQKQWRTFEDKCPHRLAPLSGMQPHHCTASVSAPLEKVSGMSHDCAKQKDLTICRFVSASPCCAACPQYCSKRRSSSPRVTRTKWHFRAGATV